MSDLQKLSDINYFGLNFNDSVLAKLKNLPAQEASDIVASSFFDTVEVSISITSGKDPISVSLEANLYQAIKLDSWFNLFLKNYDLIEKDNFLNPGKSVLHNVDLILSAEDKCDLLNSDLLISSISKGSEKLQNEESFFISVDDEITFEDIFLLATHNNAPFIKTLQGRLVENIETIFLATTNGYSIALKDMHETLNAAKFNSTAPVILMEMLSEPSMIWDENAIDKKPAVKSLISGFLNDYMEKADLKSLNNLEMKAKKYSYDSKLLINLKKIMIDESMKAPETKNDSGKSTQSFKL